MSSQVAGAVKAGGTPLSAANPNATGGSKDDDNGASKDAGAVVTQADAVPTELTNGVSVHAFVPNATSGGRKAGGGTALSKAPAANHETQFFFEDEVFRIDRKGRVRFGVITETPESYSSDEEDDTDDVLGRGEVRVAFYPDGKEIVQTEQSIGLADRTLMPGDVVRRRLPGQKDLTGQTGYVRDVSVRADVKVLGTKYIIKNVPSERLRQISEWARDVPVCFGTWIGTTLSVDESAVLKSANGACLEITSNDFHKFKDVYGPSVRDVFNPNVYYPGNIVKGRLPPLDRVKNLTPEISLPPNRKYRSVYTVESVKTTAITVAWTCKAVSHCDKGNDTDPLKQPKSCIKGDDLVNVKRLNLYESYMLQIHDRFYLKYSKCDKLDKLSNWEAEQALVYLAIFQRQQSDLCKQNAANGIDNTPSTASGSRVSRHGNKARRYATKNSMMRLQRSQASSEHFNMSATTTVSPTKVQSKPEVSKTDDIWDSVEEDDDDEETQEPQDAPDAVTEVVDSMETELADPTNEDSIEATTTTALSNAAPSQVARFASRYAKRRHVKKKMRMKKPLASPFAKKDGDPKDGDELVVETLVVYSTVTVVWQDGTVEPNVPSTELYPIHHLDNHEFFPGDFVSKSNDCGPSHTDYGVIQSVDHDERIAKVKWFNIYANMDNPIPSCKEVEELSVYDIKDHTDYQYRPGTMVIRVSNFTGEDLNSTAGQVIDNFPDGRVRVWWAKGHITMCYPQDLFEINHSDQDQEPYESDCSDDSWETQSDGSGLNISLNSLDSEEHIISGIDSAQKALKRLEKLFRVSPEQKKTTVLNDLVSIYKNCRFLDRLLGTKFFHEDNFQGIVRRKVLSKTCSHPTKEDETMDLKPSVNLAANTNVTLPETTETDATKPEPTAQSTPNKDKSFQGMGQFEPMQCDGAVMRREDESAEFSDESDKLILENVELSASETKLTHKQLISKYRLEYATMLNTARTSIAKAFEKGKQCKNDSGVSSRGENTSNDFSFVKEPKQKSETLHATSDTSIELIVRQDTSVCEIFCFLLNEHLDKCREQIEKNFAKSKEKDIDDEDAVPSDEKSAMSNKSEEDLAVPISNKEKNDEGDDDALEDAINLNGHCESLPSLDSPVACSSPSQILDFTPISENCFVVQPGAPPNHHFYANIIHPMNRSQYQRAIQREYRMLQASLPQGVFVRAYENRMDLMSVMMVGPKRTPYQNALFFFDFQMGREYPKSPPTCHYISYCTERLNPNLYEEGKVCVSLLGTWAGRDYEVWSPDSTMLQVLVSIQGLILVDEPYYNEAGYEKQRGTQLGCENSRVYNEMAIIKIAHSTVKQLQNPPQIFRKEVLDHFREFGDELHGRMQGWSDFSLEAQRLKVATIDDMPKEYKERCDLPEFPLLPCSRGFCVAVKGVLTTMKNELNVLKNEKPMAAAPRAAPEDV
ncbi:(E3-independent) E2 ubiquitin-conjugating enzyme [Scaptodrosophila lebanonensis]|uniref:(E3-independent) E2 ubiquitin-conjugating enzyme n=1 Tax=Drosophila lebanonensis TaxID=7225 RepID=A0A6J2T492_DROLE|nr:(E3-independent) E2 ubiquitin-conjugating enzyme [Scaptodrosophila lebanonensis]